ncbi:MAG TPA: tryptophan--tRNA ligase, partial [Actinoplanes sp.]|nr:tryptophan--tRNA ligase [Actinoplanes sp.]
LQAADILLYQADAVPVGEDQRQHLELTRDLAQRFNTRFGATFTVPTPYIVRDTAKIYDLQQPTAKMSKSASSPNGIIELLEEPARSAKKIKSAVTDTGREILFDLVEKPGIANLLTIYAALSGRTIDELLEEYDGKGYGDLKKDLAEVVREFVTPIQQRTRDYLADPAQLDKLLAGGADKARAVAGQTLRDAYERVGFLAAGCGA